jgi:hypothetical protein
MLKDGEYSSLLGERSLLRVPKMRVQLRNAAPGKRGFQAIVPSFVRHSDSHGSTEKPAKESTSTPTSCAMWVTLLHDRVYPFGHSDLVGQHLCIGQSIGDTFCSSSTKANQRRYACDPILDTKICHSPIRLIARVELRLREGDTGELVSWRGVALSYERFEDGRYSATWSTGRGRKESQKECVRRGA